MDGDNLKCSFCGKGHDQIEQLIAGTGGVAICTECVDLCNEIIADTRAAGAIPPRGPGQAGGAARTTDPGRHRITISGGSREAIREAFGDFEIEPRGADTVLIGEVDQARMRDVLRRVKALSPKIVDLSRQDD